MEAYNVSVIDFFRRWGPYFFSAFIALVIGLVQVLIFIKNPILIATILIILSTFCFVATIIALYYDIKEAHRKDKEAKKEKTFQALKESFMHAGLSEKAAEIAAKGR